MNKENIVFQDERKTFIKRLLNDFFSSWSTTLVLIIGFSIGLKHSYVLWGFSILAFFFFLRSIVWSYWQITKASINGDQITLSFQVLNTSNELMVRRSGIEVQLLPVFVKDDSHKVIIKANGIRIKQYPNIILG